MKRKALGKGLSALLPGPEDQSGPSIPQELPVGSLSPNPEQPRGVMNPQALAELEASIRSNGIVQPLLVRPHAGGYQIVAGERRFRAAKTAGLTHVPVVVRTIPDESLLEVALVENVQRENLSILEEAAAYRKLQDALGLSQEDIARKVGKDRSTVANAVRLLRLPKEVKRLLGEGRLDGGHGRALLALEREEDQIALAREAARKGLSVREVERRVVLARTSGQKKEKTRQDANSRAAEERLRAALGVRVQIVRSRKGGHLKVAFGNEDELNRLFEQLTRTSRRS